MSTLLLAFLAAAAATASPNPTLRVGLDPRGAPWAFVPGYDYTHESVRATPRLKRGQLERLTGLDVETLRALERRMGARMEIVQTAWREIETGLLAGRYDLILNAWTPSASTPAGILASEPYFEWGLLVAARAADPSIRSVTDLAGRRIGHIRDPAVLPALRAMGTGLGAKLVVVDQGGEDLFSRLGRQELDAIVFDSAFVRWRVARDKAFRVVGEPLNRLGYHVGVRASDPALFERVQAAVRDFAGSPEAGAIRRKWESAETPAP
jgi:polar amino acid transport system substrate-binding protein